MLETVTMNEQLNFQPLSAEEKLQRGILGRLYGPVASFTAPTRNGRKYTEELWEKVFRNDIVEELFSRGGIPGELDHPDRDETCSEKIAIMMPEKPKKDKQGHLIGYFDILDTPCGRIAATLAKYGFQFGISSRGSGDTFTDYDGQESVDPDTYTLNAFDLVLVPACKDAVLSLVEGYQNRTDVSLKTALNEALQSASDTEREIMQETLNNLNIDYEPASLNIDADNNKEESIPEPALAAEDIGADMVKELQETLKQNTELEAQIKDLQEQLSVCFTKEARYEIVLERTKASLVEANKQVALEKDNASKLAENLNQMRSIISEQNLEIKNQKDQLMESANSLAQTKQELNASNQKIAKLNENLRAQQQQVKTFKEQLSAQQQDFESQKTELTKQNSMLTENLAEAKKDSKILKSQANAKLSKANQLTEKYRSIAKTAVDKYIECRAIALGISTSDIKHRLKENYSFNDIDAACEKLQQYKINMQALPFDTNEKKSLKMKLTESRVITDPAINEGIDDEIDESLTSFIANTH